MPRVTIYLDERLRVRAQEAGLSPSDAAQRELRSQLAKHDAKRPGGTTPRKRAKTTSRETRKP